MRAKRMETRPGCRRVAALSALLLCLGVGEALAVPEWSMVTRLYGDEKARAIGDLVTVVIEEKSKASKSAESSSDNSTSGGGSMSVGTPYYTKDTKDGEETVGGPWTRATLPSFDWKFGRSFSGGGKTSSEEDLSSTLTARVLDVLPNGNLLIEGRRLVEMQDEKVEVILTGMVRPRDIASDNSVYSSRLADASIRYETRGPLARDQRRGLLTRLVNWINPF